MPPAVLKNIKKAADNVAGGVKYVATDALSNAKNVCDAMYVTDMATNLANTAQSVAKANPKKLLKKASLGGSSKDVYLSSEVFSFHYNSVTDQHAPKFLEKYEVLEKLPTFPFCHKCTAKKSDADPRAVQILPKNALRSPTTFLSDLNRIKELNHPNLIHILESFEDTKHFYIVTDDLDHPNLYDAATEMGANFGQAHVAKIILTLLECLNYCHTHVFTVHSSDPEDKDKSVTHKIKGLPHGHIHPKNILVPHAGDFEKLLLVDFIGLYLQEPKKAKAQKKQGVGSGTDAETDDSDLESSDSDVVPEDKPKVRPSTSAAPPSHSNGNSKRAPPVPEKRISNADPVSKLTSAAAHRNSATKRMSAMPAQKLNYKTNSFSPPELQQTGPTLAGDIWVTGILTFHLLTGKYPFSKPSERTKRPFEKEQWHGVTNSAAKEFIRDCLHVEPSKRPLAVDACDYDWFKKAEKLASKIDANEQLAVHTRLATCKSQNEMQLAVSTFIATNFLKKEERATLDAIFKQADRNMDGVLSKQELRLSLEKAGQKFSPKEMDKLFERMDVNKQDSISYTEFLTVAADSDMLLQRDKLKQAFDTFDTDDDGFITSEELQSIFSRGGGAEEGRVVVSSKAAKSMVKQADKDGDGKIDFDEFVNMMMNLQVK